MKALLQKFGYSFVSYESGKGRITIDRGLRCIPLKWRSGSRLVKNGKVLVMDECGEIFAKTPESQDHRKYITIPVLNTLNR